MKVLEELLDYIERVQSDLIEIDHIVMDAETLDEISEYLKPFIVDPEKLDWLKGSHTAQLFGYNIRPIKSEFFKGFFIHPKINH